ncbi:MAG: SRPBCC domain-containing protein [Bacteroidota bacterium]
MSTITTEAVFEATKENVWAAITNTEIMKIWYFDMSNFKLEVGNEFTFYETDGTSYLHKCKVLHFSENQMLQHTWTHPEQSKGSSVVTWKIEEVDSNKVKVTLTHEGVESFADAGPNFVPANYQMGWNALVKTSLRNYLYNIKKLVFEVKINATAESIWTLMWDKKTYTDWVKPFCEGTYFTGEMEVGSRIHFLTPTGDGMFSDVFYLQPNKIVIFKHIGNVSDFKEQPLDAETEKWTGCFETYKLNEIDGTTTVIAEVDCIEQYINSMNKMFPVALQELKNISEKK